MIVEAILNLIKLFLLGVLSLFPSIPEMGWASGVIGPVVQVFSAANHLIDLKVALLCLGAFFVFSNIQLIWGIIMWVIRKIPGVE